MFKQQTNIVKSIYEWGYLQLELNNMLVDKDVINN